eukprot:TRINITY_DN2475_c0_g4_i1.p1 TRINITY_DN2475_c0_g4~~TRINITY_DN2475_c0_g4_i1.p1  ORF type:complete len:193 (+),score=57.60 TRINITY_DN2475_c0_g4_i1:29-580(+)
MDGIFECINEANIFIRNLEKINEAKNINGHKNEVGMSSKMEVQKEMNDDTVNIKKNFAEQFDEKTIIFAESDIGQKSNDLLNNNNGSELLTNVLFIHQQHVAAKYSKPEERTIKKKPSITNESQKFVDDILECSMYNRNEMNIKSKKIDKYLEHLQKNSLTSLKTNKLRFDQDFAVSFISPII